MSAEDPTHFQNTQEIKENAFYLDKTEQNVQSFEEFLFFKLRTSYGFFQLRSLPLLPPSPL